MKIINNPSEVILQKIQKILTKENEDTKFSVGIIDLGGSDGCLHYVALDDNEEPIGVATLQFESELYKLYVVPIHRKHKVAEGLVKHVMEVVKKTGESELFIETTDQAIPFWNKLINDNNFKIRIVPNNQKFYILL
ncbi:GNAT family N-acetyltransferase [Pectobacterium versatile]|uniref:GNAT family N-acetyltransferase n=1 Tax=Pectobacterium versatile TaxID=2488639 RepID=UPI001B35FFBD|nr:GNAT family N-acetyltransferase [Pectobacterium versatile]MBQ4796478.1 GNAT family N-acetyltransferase [Pectobacterium versatile]